MIKKIVNFSHPFSLEQTAAIRAAVGDAEIVQIVIQYDPDGDWPAQAMAALQQACARGEEGVAICFPALAGELMAAVAVGYLGYLPWQVVINAARGSVPPRFAFSHIESLEEAAFKSAIP